MLPEPDRFRFALAAGDILLEKSGGGEKTPVGFAVVWDGREPAVCSNFISRLRLVDGADPRFWTYVLGSLHALRITERSAKQTTGIQNLDEAAFLNEVVPIPPPSDQSSIADYLDRQTAEIDAFIADQERLIELLTERRTATITRAVTVGIVDGDRQRTKSPWIPLTHPSWRLLQLRRLGITSESGTSVNGYTSPASDGEIGVLKTGAASKGYFDPTENKRVVDEDIARVTCPVREGTLLVNRANSPELVGSAAFVDCAPANLYLSDKLWQVTIKAANPRFVHYWTRSAVYRQQLIALSVGASNSMQNLSLEDFMSLDIAVPDLPTQDQIVHYLDGSTAEIDASVADARRAVELSRERRAALITAAVTDQIDVRTGRAKIVSASCQTGSQPDEGGNDD